MTWLLEKRKNNSTKEKKNCTLKVYVSVRGSMTEEKSVEHQPTLRCLHDESKKNGGHTCYSTLSSQNPFTLWSLFKRLLFISLSVCLPLFLCVRVSCCKTWLIWCSIWLCTITINYNHDHHIASIHSSQRERLLNTESVSHTHTHNHSMKLFTLASWTRLAYTDTHSYFFIPVIYA